MPEALCRGRNKLFLVLCRFHDICLNHTSMEFQYYVDPAAAETPLFYHYLNANPHYTFPQDFIMTGHVHILPYTPWAPKVGAPTTPNYWQVSRSSEGRFL